MHPFELKEAQELPVGPVKLGDRLGKSQMIRSSNERGATDNEFHRPQELRTSLRSIEPLQLVFRRGEFNAAASHVGEEFLGLKLKKQIVGTPTTIDPLKRPRLRIKNRPKASRGHDQVRATVEDV